MDDSKLTLASAATAIKTLVKGLLSPTAINTTYYGKQQQSTP
jgi:hypothetical protein